MMLLDSRKKVFITLSFVLLLQACSNGSSSSDELSSQEMDEGISNLEIVELKPYPAGVYESAGGLKGELDDVVARTPLSPGQDGVLVKINWDICNDDLQCLLDTIQINLDTAESLGLFVSLAISDGSHAPPAVKANCENLYFEFRGEARTMCRASDSFYLQAKENMLREVGERFDSHEALAAVYFTGACTTNGVEGHCRIDESHYPDISELSTAYVTIMSYYLDAFPSTPLVFEAHTIFDSIDIWTELWASVESTGRVGVAAWWCSERLSINGSETEPAWSLIQTIANETFSVCQTVGNFSSQPYRFSDASLGLDYGEEEDWNEADTINAFNQTFDWLNGYAIHAGQAQLITPFSVIEVWTQDLKNSAFTERLSNF